MTIAGYYPTPGQTRPNTFGFKDLLMERVDPTRRFRYACQRVHDNLKTGEVGYVRDDRGGFYRISKDRRSAARVSENEAPDIAKLFEGLP